MAALVLAVVSAKSMQSQTLHLLHAFNSGEGASSQTSLIRDSGGNLYGTTLQGGGFRAGTVFKLDKAHTLTVLYTFIGGHDGSYPYSSLLRDSSGNLYGTTSEGGSPGVVGTVFKIDPSGTKTTLHSFNNTDGRLPHGDLVRDKAGNFYGTTLEGGSSGNFGTIFKLDTTGKLTTLYEFTNTGDGSGPSGKLVRDAAGSLYGTCQSGTVYKLDTTGALTVLHTFRGSDGGPYGGLIADSAGNLYGTTSLGGTNNGGTVFRVTKTNGAFTLLHTFESGKTIEGEGPDGTLARDAVGNLYGANVDGGSGCQKFQGCGTIWKLDIDNKLTVLTNFGKGNRGRAPQGGVILDKAGNLYGTTSEGGSPGCGDCGTVFKITP
jgi:uncharacterized repeat protein (TIGR03803 family)